jgi:hypothetical protein
MELAKQIPTVIVSLGLVGLLIVQERMAVGR